MKTTKSRACTYSYVTAPPPRAEIASVLVATAPLAFMVMGGIGWIIYSLALFALR